MQFTQIEQKSWKGEVDDCQWLVSSVGKSWVRIRFHPPLFHLIYTVIYWKLWIILKLRVPSSWSSPSENAVLNPDQAVITFHLPKFPGHLLWYLCIFVYWNLNVELFLPNPNMRLTHMSSIYKTLWCWSFTVTETMHGCISWGHNNA